MNNRDYYSLKEKGLCTRCGKPANGKSVCKRCVKNAIRNEKRRRIDRSSRGLCWYCNNKIVEGSRLCKWHGVE